MTDETSDQSNNHLATIEGCASTARREVENADPRERQASTRRRIELPRVGFLLCFPETGRSVFVVQDAIGSGRAKSTDAAIRRMERHGAENVMAEMATFEWVATCEHPRFREFIALVK